MTSMAKAITRDFLDWPFFEPRHREVCEALDRFVMWGGLDAIDHTDVDGACRKLVRALGTAKLLDCAVAAPDSDVTTIDSRSIPQFVFEAHSTDYQPRQALTALVEDGFAILKVGPGVTFALREALYGLDHIASFMAPSRNDQSLRETMERLMIRHPANWAKYYHGSNEAQHIQRHFSYSDRIRYYWPHPEVAAAVSALFARLESRTLPETLVSQYLGSLYPAVSAGTIPASARDLVIAAVRRVLSQYGAATSPSRSNAEPRPAA